MDSEPFGAVLLRRVRLPLPLSVRRCSCGRFLDHFGHHRAACSTVGVLSRRGFAVESAIAQICREGGARVSTNIFLRDLDLDLVHFSTCDGRRLEVVAEGLSLFGGSQLAFDATLDVGSSRGWEPPKERRQERRGRPVGSTQVAKRGPTPSS